MPIIKLGEHIQEDIFMRCQRMCREDMGINVKKRIPPNYLLFPNTYEFIMDALGDLTFLPVAEALQGEVT